MRWPKLRDELINITYIKNAFVSISRSIFEERIKDIIPRHNVKIDVTKRHGGINFAIKGFYDLVITFNCITCIKKGN
ncbi:unnamed protein product [Rhizophagus irregularis]|nr:unnamed protein product [Rhizophagus irregularis]